MAISIDTILMGRIKYDQLPIEQKTALKALHAALFDLETAYVSAGNPAFKVSSGYRSAAINASASGAAKSLHMVCKACDMSDPKGVFWAWCLQNLELLQKLGLYLEDGRWTPNWVHLQIQAPKSGKRVFVPSSAPALVPQKWDGKYDKKFDSSKS